MPDKQLSTEDAEREHALAVLAAQLKAAEVNPNFDPAQKAAKLAKINAKISNLKQS